MTMLSNAGAIAEREFAHLGVDDIAYIKRVVVNEETMFAIHAADGTAIATVRDHETAMAAVRRHGLEPLSVH
ncbi:MAG TPA: DUF1150 family protein [Stellaceae bacterium]|nr:DUF1150 family protein [Stellaceae bacterium]